LPTIKEELFSFREDAANIPRAMNQRPRIIIVHLMLLETARPELFPNGRSVPIPSRQPLCQGTCDHNTTKQKSLVLSA
jgi:hypothetical protein